MSDSCVGFDLHQQPLNLSVICLYDKPAIRIRPEYIIFGQVTMEKSHLLGAACAIILAITSNTSAYALVLTNYDTISMPGASTTYAFGIEGTNVVGYYVDSGHFRGYLYDGTTYTPIDVPGADDTVLFGIDGGNIVGSYADSSAHGLLYDGSSYTPIDPPGGGITILFDIDGSMIVGRQDGDGFLYDGTTFTTLDGPTGTGVEAYGVDGSNIVGIYNDGTEHGFLYDGATYTILDVPGATSTSAEGIDGNRIVGTYYDGVPHGFIYDGSTYTTLDIDIATSTYVSGIYGNTVVGNYTDASNNTYGFTASLVPIPPTNVIIDIKPNWKNNENEIDLKRDKSLKVAILFEGNFDPVSQVDPTTVLFGPAPASTSRYQVKDADKDGDVDLILIFKTKDTGIECGHTAATLTGQTYGGDDITGSDTFTVVPCP